MNRIIILIILVAIATFGGYYILKGSQKVAETLPAEQTSGEASLPQETTERLPEVEAPTEKSNLIIYTDAGYSPKTLQIQNGDTVTFTNQSTRSMWPASAMHPSHKVYPTTGGCIGSTFDACTSILPDGSWTFKFDASGTWKYHDHLNPSDFGTIVVE